MNFLSATLNILPGDSREEVRHFKRFGDVSSDRTLDPHGSSRVLLGKARQVVELVVYAPQAGVDAIPFSFVRQPCFGGVDEVLPPSHDVGLGACICDQSTPNIESYLILGTYV